MTQTAMMPMTAMSWPTTNPQKVTMRWVCADPETAATLARSVQQWVAGALVWWDGLPAWQATYHLTCKKIGAGAVVELRMWPQPDDSTL